MTALRADDVSGRRRFCCGGEWRRVVSTLRFEPGGLLRSQRGVLRVWIDNHYQYTRPRRSS